MDDNSSIQYHYVGEGPRIYRTGAVSDDGKEVYAWSRLSVKIDTLYPEGYLQKHGILLTVLPYIVTIITI